MNPTIKNLLSRYNCQSPQDYSLALREVLQELMLLGLSRGGFFKTAAFYGGTALRIFHGLDRFSEDMNFTLLEPDNLFDLKPHLEAVKQEINALGFDVKVERKKKSRITAIQSAFVKANTLEHLLHLTPLEAPVSGIAPNKNLRVKLEVDTDPPLLARTEILYRFTPQAFPVRIYDLESLFAGKLHALLCRNWKERVKGRDFYDYLWYMGKGVQPNWQHLETRMRQSGHYTNTEPLTAQALKKLLLERFNSVNWQQVLEDITPFVDNPRTLEFWSPELFRQTVEQFA